MTPGKQLSEIAERIWRVGNRLISQRIAGGRLTTKEYRQFCKKHDVAPKDGVFIPGKPGPFPLKNPMKCERCGEVIEKNQILSVLSYQNGDDSPPEYIEECPECEEQQELSGYSLFDEVAKCEECGEYPCCCERE